MWIIRIIFRILVSSAHCGVHGLARGFGSLFTELCELWASSAIQDDWFGRLIKFEQVRMLGSLLLMGHEYRALRVFKLWKSAIIDTTVSKYGYEYGMNSFNNNCQFSEKEFLRLAWHHLGVLLHLCVMPLHSRRVATIFRCSSSYWYVACSTYKDRPPPFNATTTLHTVLQFGPNF